MASVSCRCLNRPIFTLNNYLICSIYSKFNLLLNESTNRRLLYLSHSFNEGIKEVSLTQNNNESSNFEEEDISLLKKKQNKSGLREKHYHEIHSIPPLLTDDELNILPLWLYRKRFGKYGKAANINFKALWPSSQEMEREKELERVEFPNSVQEMILKAKQEKHDTELEIVAKQLKIQENMKNLDKWMNEVRERKRKQEMEAMLSMEKKRQQIEEVRQIFGYSISPHDERFQEALDKKIEEDKKRMKKERKLKKQQQLLERLQEEAESQKKDSLLGKPVVEGREPPPIK